MTVMEDFLNINKTVMEKSVNNFKKNWILIFVGIVYSVIQVVGYTLIGTLFRGPLGIIGGIVGAFISASLISNYLYLIYNVIYFNDISMEKFKYGFKAFLRPVYSVLVFGWIASYFLGVLGLINPLGVFTLNQLIIFVVFIVFNALPETIYQKDYHGMDIIEYSGRFFKDNILNWAVPNIVFYLVLYVISGRLNFSILPISSGGAIVGPVSIIAYLLQQVIFTFMMIYRGQLFKILSTSTKRKREFMSKF